jgi:putative transcriptional regulator
VERLRGQLLVASPALLDPNFRRTVILVVEHSDEGALGLVLNRVSANEIAEVAAPLDELIAPGERIHLGGPVETGAVLVVAEFDDPEDAATLVVGDIGLVPSDGDFETLSERTRRARVFSGYTGWGPGQLDAELAEESWIVEPADPDDVFSDSADELWSEVLRRKGGPYALVARMPPDPSLN